jgi:hypothetical protein
LKRWIINSESSDGNKSAFFFILVINNGRFLRRAGFFFIVIPIFLKFRWKEYGSGGMLNTLLNDYGISPPVGASQNTIPPGRQYGILSLDAGAVWRNRHDSFRHLIRALHFTSDKKRYPDPKIPIHSF